MAERFVAVGKGMINLAFIAYVEVRQIEPEKRLVVHLAVPATHLGPAEKKAGMDSKQGHLTVRVEGKEATCLYAYLLQGRIAEAP